MNDPGPDTEPSEMKRYADALRAAREAEPRALDEVIAELSPMLWRVARAQGLDRVSAEDVVQNTWLKLMKSLSSIDNPGALSGWLATTARREAWNLSKRQRRERPDDREWDGQVAQQGELDDEVVERMGLAPRYQTLWNVVGQLPERCLGLIQVIAYTERPDYSQVAEALGMPRGSIGPTRGRCLAKLRQLLHSNPEWNQRGET